MCIWPADLNVVDKKTSAPIKLLKGIDPAHDV